MAPSGTESSSSPDDEGESDGSVSSKMDELVREMEAERSESDEEDRKQGSQQARGVSERKRRMRYRGDDDSPAATICALVHSCWFMRIPVIYKDFIRFVFARVCFIFQSLMAAESPQFSLIETYTLPYLDPIRLFPESLTRHLTRQAKQALTPHASVRFSLALSLAVYLKMFALIPGVVATGRADSYSLTHNHLSARSTVLRTVRNFHTRAEYGADSVAHGSAYGRSA